MPDTHNIADHYVAGLHALGKAKKAAYVRDQFSFFEPSTSWKHTTLAITGQFMVDKHEALEGFDASKGNYNTFVLTVFDRWFSDLCRKNQVRYSTSTSLDEPLKVRGSARENNTEQLLIDTIEDPTMTNQAESKVRLVNFVTNLSEEEVEIVSDRLMGRSNAETAERLGFSTRTYDNRMNALKNKARKELS